MGWVFLGLGLFVFCFEEVGEGFLVLGAGGDLVLDGGEGMRGWWRTEALAGVGLDGLGRGEDFFLCFRFGHARGASCVMVQRTPDRRCVYRIAEEKMKSRGGSGEFRVRE